jgi:hypothetical protein
MVSALPKRRMWFSQRSQVVFFHVQDVTHTLHSLLNAHAHTHMPNAIHLLFNVVAYCTIILDRCRLLLLSIEIQILCHNKMLLFEIISY